MVAHSSINDDIDYATKWWSSYSTRNYTDMAKAQTTYDNYIGDVFGKPKRMARSASMTNLTYIKDAVHEYPIKRSDSISSLAPSLALPQDLRDPQRIVHTTHVYKPLISDWYNKSYGKAYHKDTLESLNKPLYRKDTGVTYYSSHVPYYTLQTKRIFNEQRDRQKKSYLNGSCDYMKNYVSARLKADDFAQRFVHTAYEARYIQDHAFNRHFMFGERVYIPHAPSNPYAYINARHDRNIFKTTGRYNFFKY